MAEYIDREKLIPDRCYHEPYGYEAVSCEQIFHEDAADVIERSKINKAIKEMEIHIKCNTDQRTGKVNILGQGQIMMLDILKRNIEG